MSRSSPLFVRLSQLRTREHRADAQLRGGADVVRLAGADPDQRCHERDIGPRSRRKSSILRGRQRALDGLQQRARASPDRRSMRTDGSRASIESARRCFRGTCAQRRGVRVARLEVAEVVDRDTQRVGERRIARPRAESRPIDHADSRLLLRQLPHECDRFRRLGRLEGQHDIVSRSARRRTIASRFLTAPGCLSRKSAFTAATLAPVRAIIVGWLC